MIKSLFITLLLIPFTLIGFGQALADRGFIRDFDGSSIVNRAVTATLYVSPNGDNSDGFTLKRAYQTLSGALSAASTDKNECTLIVVGINTDADFYDINTPDDPTFTGNYIIKGTNNTWQKIKNTHAEATSILKFTGHVSLDDLSFDLGTGSANGVIITQDGFRVNSCRFAGTELTGAATALHIDGATTLEDGKIINCEFLGDRTYMTGILMDNTAFHEISDILFNECLAAIQIVNDASDLNTFDGMYIKNCAIGIDIDAGNEQRISNVQFADNTVNIDDEVGDHTFDNLKGDFAVTILPDNLVGITIAANATANLWGADTEIIAADVIDAPFRVLSFINDPGVEQWYQVRFSYGAAGTQYFDNVLLNSTKKSGSTVPTGTGFIFNKGTRISASAKAFTGGSDEVQVWLKIQIVQ